jgi:tRNA-dihydrouridine synthase
MRKPARAEAILRAVVGAVRLPVTVKFRKGYELEEDSAVDFARMAEGCGVAAVAVHGRTARQLYHGASDRSLIARVKQALSIPVIASGDVFSHADIRSYREDLGADAVMVARGARGNPWIFADADDVGGCGSGGGNNSDVADAPSGRSNNSDAADAPRPSLAERVCVAHEHTVGLARLEPRRLSSMRRHVAWYFKGTPHATAIRRAVCECRDLCDYEALFEQILAWR